MTQILCAKDFYFEMPGFLVLCLSLIQNVTVFCIEYGLTSTFHFGFCYETFYSGLHPVWLLTRDIHQTWESLIPPGFLWCGQKPLILLHFISLKLVKLPAHDSALTLLHIQYVMTFYNSCTLTDCINLQSGLERNQSQPHLSVLLVIFTSTGGGIVFDSRKIHLLTA